LENLKNLISIDVNDLNKDQMTLIQDRVFDILSKRLNPTEYSAVCFLLTLEEDLVKQEQKDVVYEN